MSCFHKINRWHWGDKIRTVSYVCLDGEQAIRLIDFFVFFVSQFILKILSYSLFYFRSMMWILKIWVMMMQWECWGRWSTNQGMLVDLWTLCSFIFFELQPILLDFKIIVKLLVINEIKLVICHDQRNNIYVSLFLSLWFHDNVNDNANQGPISRKSRKLFRPEKPFIIKTYSVKLIFSFCCKGNKNKNNCKVSCLETP